MTTGDGVDRVAAIRSRPAVDLDDRHFTPQTSPAARRPIDDRGSEGALRFFQRQPLRDVRRHRTEIGADVPRFTSPWAISCSMIGRAIAVGMAKPMPEKSPVRVKMLELMPTSSPRR